MLCKKTPLKGYRQKIFANHTSNQGPFSRIHKEFLKLSNNETIELESGQKISRDLPQEDVHMANKHVERCSASPAIRKMQTKLERYYFTPTKAGQNPNRRGQQVPQGRGETRALPCTASVPMV